MCAFSQIRSGQAKAIGVSNFDVPDLRHLLSVATEPVSANQCHFAVGSMDRAVIAFAAAHSIALESYGTLHGPVASDHPTVARVASKHNISSQGVMLKYVSQAGIALVSASDKEQYDIEDAALFGLTLDAQDVADLDALQSGARTCSDCYAEPCRQCMAALQTIGCNPGSGAECIACAADHAMAWNACGEQQTMVAKGCEMGFPTSASA